MTALSHTHQPPPSLRASIVAHVLARAKADRLPKAAVMKAYLEAGVDIESAMTTPKEYRDE